MLLQGMPGDGGGASYFRLAPGRRQPSWDLGESGGLQPAMTHSPTNKPPGPWSFCRFSINRLNDRWFLTPEEVTTSKTQIPTLGLNSPLSSDPSSSPSSKEAALTYLI